MNMSTGTMSQMLTHCFTKSYGKIVSNGKLNYGQTNMRITHQSQVYKSEWNYNQ